LPINFYIDTATVASGNATINGVPLTVGNPASVVTVNTDANGKASVTLALPAHVGNNVVVKAYEGAVSGTPSGVVSAATVQVVGASATSIATSWSQTTPYTAGTAVTKLLSITPEDSFGNVVSGDVVDVTIPTGALTGVSFQNGSGTTVAPISSTAVTGGTMYEVVVPAGGLYLNGTPATAGNFTISVKDVSAPAQPSASATLSVNKSLVTAFDLFDAAGKNLSVNLGGASDTVAAGGNIALTVAPVDAGGNQVTTDASYSVQLPAVNGAAWRTSLTGGDLAAEGQAATITFTPGQGAQTVYLVNESSNSITLTSSAANYATNATINVKAFAAGGSSYVVQDPTGATVTPSGANTYSGLATNTTYTITVTVLDANGKPAAGQAVYIDPPATPKGSVGAATLYTNSQGQVTFTYKTAGTAGQ
ncbi:hypothetical protein, partial [Alicyclobacillus acidocaldarius]|uniref:hypothetical protein n=1 Tax=Alicyclobacillus acidocaldarius TaxID=405212 RepID=UPI00345ED497